jgi:putative ABC transport system ATP-binding protein
MDAAAGAPVLTARGLIKEYREGGVVNRVLDGVGLDIAAGSFLSIMGPSGSGKSTLLHLLGGLDQPDVGEVWLRGKPLSALPDDERTRLRGEQIGIVYQFFNLIPVLTAEENVALPAVIAGRPRRDYQQRRDELLDLVGLTHHRHKLPSQLSGGQQQRVAIARALLVEPSVLLADEPTGNLDQATGVQLLDLFVDAQRARGQTIVMVTHDPRSASYGDSVVALQDGRLHARLDLTCDRPPGHPDRTRAVMRWLQDGSAEPTA